MIKHIVLWKLHDHAEGANKAENAARAKAMLEALKGRIPGLIDIEAGIDFLQSPDSADLSLCAILESKAALEDYKHHPEHQKVIPFMAAIQSSRTVVDFEV